MTIINDTPLTYQPSYIPLKYDDNNTEGLGAFYLSLEKIFDKYKLTLIC